MFRRVAMLSGTAVLAIGALAVPSPAFALLTEPGDAWHADQLHLGEAHKIARGDGVTVALLGDGVDQHKDLAGALLPGLDVTGDKDGTKSGHRGTHAAGLVAARGDGRGGLLGVAPGAKVLPVRVGADPQARDAAALARGIDAAVAARAGVIALPDPNPTVTDDLRRSVRGAIGAGAVVVAPAGLTFPALATVAALPGVVSVVATDRDGRPVPDSQTGLDVDLTAPGTDLVATTKLSTGDAYVSAQGTDLAPAIVAGVAALVRSADPHAGPADVVRHLEATTAAVRHDPVRGWGQVDALAALTVPVAGLPEPAAHPDTGAGLRDRQWYLDALRVPLTHRVNRGAGVTVGLIGSGVDVDHPDLLGRVTVPGWIDGHGKLQTGAPPDAVRHVLSLDARGNTGVASVIVAGGDGAGLLGVAPDAKLLAIGGLGAGDELVAPGLRRLVEAGAKVVVIPGGAVGEASGAAVRDALRRGVVIVRPYEPENTALPGVLTVAAVDGAGKPYDLYDQGGNRELYAPFGIVAVGGSEIRYADPAKPDAAAAGFVAGVAALILAAHPDLDYANVVNRLTATATAVPPAGPVVEPLAAVTAQVPSIAAPPLPAEPAGASSRAGWIVAALLVVVAIPVVGLLLLLRARHRWSARAQHRRTTGSFARGGVG